MFVTDSRKLNDQFKRLVKTELLDLLLMSRLMSTLSAEYFDFKNVWKFVTVPERRTNELSEQYKWRHIEVIT